MIRRTATAAPPKATPTLLLTLVLASATAPTRASAEIRPEAAAEVLAGGGVDTNVFLQVAASPESPTWHETAGLWLGRVVPTVTGTLAGDWLSLGLQYQADLRLGESTGLMAQQEGTLTLAVPELFGPASAYASLHVGRYDSTRFDADAFLSYGAEAGAAFRVARSLRLSAEYRVDRRSFSNPAVVLLDHDWAHVGELRLDLFVRPWLTLGTTADLLAVRTTAVDPMLIGMHLDRARLGVDGGLSPWPNVKLVGGAWVGLQSYQGLEADRQVGGTAAVLGRLTRRLSAIARYDVSINRAVDPESHSYSRQQVMVGVIGRVTVERQPMPSLTSPEGEASSGLAPFASAGHVRFRLRAPGASAVHVVGSWNDWTEAADQRLRPTKEPGLWEITVTTGAGQFRYRFVVDGQARRPPEAAIYRPDGFGGEDGVVEVPAQ